MSKLGLPLLSVFVFLGVLTVFSQAMASPVEREDDVVTIGGSAEHWKLVWQSPPSPICVPERDDATTWNTCPCEGYAFGEKGVLDLVRTHPGKADEVFHLTPLFADSEWPAHGKAIIQQWPVLDEDKKWFDHAPKSIMDQIRERKTVKAIQVADYNHDGQATEFLLQIDVAPCGKSYDVLIGVTPANPTLHLFGTVEHPDKPLKMYRQMWDDLLNSNGDVTTVEWPCGDHGSQQQLEVRLHADAAGIHATELTYACDTDSEKGALKSAEVL